MFSLLGLPESKNGPRTAAEGADAEGRCMGFEFLADTPNDRIDSLFTLAWHHIAKFLAQDAKSILATASASLLDTVRHFDTRFGTMARSRASP